MCKIIVTNTHCMIVDIICTFNGLFYNKHSLYDSGYYLHIQWPFFITNTHCKIVDIICTFNGF